MKEVKIIFVDVLADAGEPDAGYFVLTSDGKLYKGNGTATPDEIYHTASTPTLQAVTDAGAITTNLIEGYGYKINNPYFTAFFGVDELAAAILQEVKFKHEGESFSGKLRTTIATLTNDREYTLPDQSGTLALTTDIPTTPDLQAVTDVGVFTTNNLRTQTSFTVKSSGDVDYLGGFYNVGNSYSELVSSNPAFTIFAVFSNTKIRFDNNGFGQSIKPYPTIGTTVNFTLPNVATNKYIPVTVQINGTPTSADSAGLIDLGTVGGGSGITRSINNIAVNTTAGATASTDYVYFCTGTLTLTLPTCVSNTNRYTVKCISGTLTINTTSAQTIDGTTTISVAVEDSVDIISNNTEWKIV